MIPILIDTRALSEEFSLQKSDVDALLTSVVKDLTSAAYEGWLLETKVLGQSRQQYQRGLIVVSEGRFTGAVVLLGALPNMIESGASAFDMKVGFSKGKKVKQGKNGGWYMTIPFRLATPGAAGFSEICSGSIPASVYAVVKKQPTTVTSQGVTRTQGLKFDQIPKEYQTTKTRPEVTIGEKKFDAYKNKTSNFQGVTKITTSTGGGQVMGFRRVSLNSDPMSWIHSGITARNLADKVEAKLDIEKRIDISIDNFLAAKGF